MSGELSGEMLDELRRRGVAMFAAGRGDRGRAAFMAVLGSRPDDPVALMHLALLRQHEAPAEAIALFRDAARADPEYAVRRAMRDYLAQRRRVEDGAVHEDGWLGFLEAVLCSGVLPQPTLDEIGAMPAHTDAGTESPIPKRILQYWDEKQPPGEVRELIERCRQFHPDWVHDVFDDERAQDFLAERFGMEVVDIYRGCFHVTAKCDIFRLGYLLASGGFYVDADEHCLLPLDALRRPGLDQVYCLTRGVPSCIVNGFIGTVPGSRIVGRALELCLGNMRNAIAGLPRSNVWVMTGPGALTFAILDLFCERAPPPDRTFANFALIDDPEFRRLFVSPPMQYKRHPRGNWRLE